MSAVVKTIAAGSLAQTATCCSKKLICSGRDFGIVLMASTPASPLLERAGRWWRRPHPRRAGPEIGAAEVRLYTASEKNTLAVAASGQIGEFQGELAGAPVIPDGEQSR